MSATGHSANDAAEVGEGSKRPNILMFMPDQLRYDALGCCGNDRAKTPNIDRFAGQGSLFRNCFTQASVCSQSRCSMFTGTYPHVAGHRSLENLIKPWEPNVLRSLKEAGYHVACLAPRGDTFAETVTEMSVTEYGFLETPEVVPKFAGGEKPADDDVWGRLFYKGVRNASEALDYDEAVVRSALTWLDCPPDGPWVLFMPILFPHCPFLVEEPYFSMHDRRNMPKRASVEERTGHEPLIVGGGGLPEGKVIDDMTEMVDLVPTLLSLGRVKETFPHNGKSWLPLFEGELSEHKAYAFSEGGFLMSEEPLLEQAPYPYDIKAALQHEQTALVGKAISCRDHTWTYVYRLYEPAELYDRREDPMELHNVVAEPEYAEVVRKMERDVFRWSVETSDFLPFEKDVRFPKVDLKSPREQLEERQARKGTQS